MVFSFPVSPFDTNRGSEKGKREEKDQKTPPPKPPARCRFDRTGGSDRFGYLFFYASVGFPHGKGAGPQPHYGILFFFFFLMIRSERWPAAGNGAEARGHFARSSLAPRENCTQTAFGADGVDARALV